MSFWSKLFDKQDGTVDHMIFFMFIGIMAITVCGIIMVCIDYSDFHFSDFGSAYTLLFGGTTAQSIGSGIKNKLSTPKDEEK